MRRSLLLLFFCCALGPLLKANKVYTNLYINRGTLTTVKGTGLPFLAYNSTAVFDANNAVVACVMSDTLVLTVTNNDTALHGFKIKSVAGASYTINPTASISCTLTPLQRRVYAYYDHLDYPRNTYMGLAGMIVVGGDAGEKQYYWNLKDHLTSYSQQLGYNVNWSSYYPDYFTINGKSFAQVQLDSTARINCQAGDTIYIYVLNSGRAMHSLHFHGFHPKSAYADCRIIKNDWEKDTWGMFPFDVMVLQMVPDKPGEYSVHDHNLVAVTGGNTHPNGMFTIMKIDP